MSLTPINSSTNPSYIDKQKGFVEPAIPESAQDKYIQQQIAIAERKKNPKPAAANLVNLKNRL